MGYTNTSEKDLHKKMASKVLSSGCSYVSVQQLVQSFVSLPHVTRVRDQRSATINSRKPLQSKREGRE